MNWFSWALLSALFAGATAVLAKVGVTGIPVTIATAVRTVVVLVLAVLLAVPALGPFSFSAVPPRTWWFLAASGVATGLSWLCYFRALQLGPASHVAPVDKCSVVIAVLLAVLFLHERLSARAWLALGLIVAGVLLLALED